MIGKMCSVFSQLPSKLIFEFLFFIDLLFRNRLLHEWESNVNSLVSYLEKANTGVRGRVVDQEGKPVKEANILVKRDDKPWRDSWLTTNKYVSYHCLFS